MPIRIFKLSDPEAYDILHDPARRYAGDLAPARPWPVCHDDTFQPCPEPVEGADERKRQRAHLDLYSQGREWDEGR